MAQYRVAIIPRPEGWEPECLDDVPPAPGEPLETLAEDEDVFVALRKAVAHNKRAGPAGADRWAVVVEPHSRGRIWPTMRLCTPIHYKVAAIWWPDGWEPASPLDVPNCVWQAPGDAGAALGKGTVPFSSDENWDSPPLIPAPVLTYPQAEKSVRALNRQCMDQPTAAWYVVVGVENEPVSHSVAYDASGTETTVEVRRLHVIRPEEGGRGDCSYCPAHSFPCAPRADSGGSGERCVPSIGLQGS